MIEDQKKQAEGLRKDENMFHLAKFGKHQSPINTETQEQAEPKTGMKVQEDQTSDYSFISSESGKVRNLPKTSNKHKKPKPQLIQRN